MTTPNNHKQWKTPLVCLCFLAVGIPGALLARQYILAQPGLPAHPEISDSTNAGTGTEQSEQPLRLSAAVEVGHKAPEHRNVEQRKEADPDVK